MSRKEEIICATLELASEYGLKAVSLSQIADKVGIKKPSLYNHFKSKEEIVSEMYSFFRAQAQKNNIVSADYSGLFENRCLEEILRFSLSVYMNFVSDKKMLAFFKVLYSERSTSPVAAQIILEETNCMINNTKALFYALVVHGKMKNDNVDIAAVSYAMTINSLIDMQMDIITAKNEEMCPFNEIPNDIQEYVKWFSKQMEVEKNE